MRKAFSESASVFKNPYVIVGVTTFIWHIVVWVLNIPFSWTASGVILVIDCVLIFALTDRLTYFFAQFVLPIRKAEDRKEIYTRVRDFRSGKRGPILFVKNGRVIKHENEDDKEGDGVLVLDSASAVVLRTDSNIVGAVGPGIRFTNENEYIISHLVDEDQEPIGVDLRTQWQFIGPQANDQPLLNPTSTTNPKPEVQKRYLQTVGLTRDGFEVAPTISIKFNVRRAKKIQPNSNGVKSRFRYDANAVRDAVTREAIHLDKSENKKVRLEWKQLPAQLVINLWREYVRKVKFEELFSNSSSMSGLRHIEEMIKQRVYKPEVVILNETGKPDSLPKKHGSLEYQQLEEHGLEITEVRIHNVMFDGQLENDRIQQWSAEWTKIAKREEALLAEKQILVETASRNEAFKKFTRVASQKFDNPIAPTQDIYTTLQNLIEPIKDNLLTENGASSNAEAELRKLNEVLKWIIVNKQDLMRKSPGGDA